jgi:hypothetical protein
MMNYRRSPISTQRVSKEYVRPNPILLPPISLKQGAGGRGKRRKIFQGVYEADLVSKATLTISVRVTK